MRFIGNRFTHATNTTRSNLSARGDFGTNENPDFEDYVFRVIHLIIRSKFETCYLLCIENQFVNKLIFHFSSHKVDTKNILVLFRISFSSSSQFAYKFCDRPKIRSGFLFPVSC